ncbi:4'-phosphopantetheinyl transferase family protein [Herbaspirillum rubrisubalbicans]|uniref:Phosphopantetheinyl transferase n=1 Tax=Herbaspirillum rubrisubalbicans TaxID=80842 RepID=A0AAD0U9N9_9BURK|nr:4'-phosphopantetheinyl transferase superfamily protein [Herbaspirillum rubrisubalbicans]ALU90844.1 4'-phosphopantetheinyl transferase protein [Herbaspirillum rubrisubalbicans M1]AYR25892.1 phosphopantetheinyl transferase [Herbaspirillum rubrisubalbicans]
MPSTFAWIVDGGPFVAETTSSAALGSLARILSADERARLQAFLRPQRACEFLLGRLLLRHALMAVCGCTLDDIEVKERRGAAPLVMVAGQLADGIDHPAASLSHSRGWIACALGVVVQVGVDIEVPAQERDLQSLADLAFTSEELAWLTQQSPEQQQAAFYRLWCANEADYKYRHNASLTRTPVAAQATPYLHHEHDPHYHLCLCSPTRPERHQSARVGLESLLELTCS